MKKYFVIVWLLIVCTIFSCKSTSNDHLIGVWIFEELEYENLDKLCQYEVQHTLQSIDNQLSMLDMEIDSTSGKDKDAIQKKRADLQALKAVTTIEEYEKEYNELAQSLKGHFKYEFEKSGKFVASFDGDRKNGTWVFRNDSILTTHEGQEADVLVVNELTNSSLVIVVETANQAPLKRILKFKKQ